MRGKVTCRMPGCTRLAALLDDDPKLPTLYCAEHRDPVLRASKKWRKGA